MLSSAVQPSLVSLFSSTGSEPLGLFSTHTDPSLPADSVIHLLNDSTSLPSADSAKLISLPPLTVEGADSADKEGEATSGYSLDQTVLHIQSPTLRTTYIRCPPKNWISNEQHGIARQRPKDLGIKHPWMHIQVRDLGREWSFEVGLVDRDGKEGVVRCSTFQKEPTLKLSSPPLLHLPLAFPATSSARLTAWSTITLNLLSLLPHLSSTHLIRQDEEEDSGQNYGHVRIPGGSWSHVSYVKVYATCRLRRIWFSEAGPSGRIPWEFQLYAAD